MVIATGCFFPRLVAKTLARQLGKAMEATCSLFQFVFPLARKLLEVPSLQGFFPFVQFGSSALVWQFTFFDETQREMLLGELLYAFLDDIYVVCSQAGVPTVFNVLSEKFFAAAGIRLHANNTRVWNEAGISLQHWRSGAQGTPRRSKFLGTPSVQMRSCRLLPSIDWKEERRLREAIPWVPDVQCGWQIPLECAGRRCLEDSPSFTNRLGTPKAMTHGCGVQWKLFLEESQEVQNRRKQPTRSCHF